VEGAAEARAWCDPVEEIVRSNSCWLGGEGTKEMGRSEEVHFGGMFMAWLGQLEDMVLIEYNSSSLALLMLELS